MFYLVLASLSLFIGGIACMIWIVNGQKKEGKTELSGNYLIGQEITASCSIKYDEIGKGELHGSIWQLRNLGETEINPGDRCLVEGSEGVTLLTRARNNASSQQ